jgi:hypothetical protein
MGLDTITTDSDNPAPKSLNLHIDPETARLCGTPGVLSLG